MNTLVIDCGTSNTKLIFMNDETSCEYIIDKGVRDIAAGFNIGRLKELIIEKIISQSISADRIIVSGMGTSELGLRLIEHQMAPVSFSDIVDNVITDKDIFGELNLITYFIPGVKNNISDINLENMSNGYDFMRGEETQVFGLDSKYLRNRHLSVIILSSHTKIIDVENEVINYSFTTLSGQLYQVIKENTILSKSLGKLNDIKSFEMMYNLARESIDKYGILRSLMNIRFMDTLNLADENDRILFLNLLIIIDDMKMIREQSRSENYMLVGQSLRCQLYKLVLEKEGVRDVDIISDKYHVYSLSYKGAVRIVDEKLK